MPKNKNRKPFWTRTRASKQIVIDEGEWFAPDGKVNVFLSERSSGEWQVYVSDADDGLHEIFLKDERKARWIFDRIVHLTSRRELRALGLK